MLAIEGVLQRASDFDVVHFHLDYLHYPASRRQGVVCVTTLHGRLGLPQLSPLYDEFRDQRVISISNSQRTPLPQAHWIGTVHHGLPHDLYSPRERRGEHLAFIGRVSPEKRVDRAIEVAKRSGVPLKIAAKVSRADRGYFEQTIAPLLKCELVEYLGELAEHEKQELLGNARALLFMVDWPEPFGLAMVEAMACGTPVIAQRCGSIPEVVQPGVTGVIVDDLEQAVAAVHALEHFDRRRCRAEFERRFLASRMAAEYVALYERAIDQPARRAKRLSRMRVA